VAAGRRGPSQDVGRPSSIWLGDLLVKFPRYPSGAVERRRSGAYVCEGRFPLGGRSSRVSSSVAVYRLRPAGGAGRRLRQRLSGRFPEPSESRTKDTDIQRKLPYAWGVF